MIIIINNNHYYYKYSTRGHVSSSALSVFQSGNLAVNGRRDLFVLTRVSSSNGYTMMLVLTRRNDFKKIFKKRAWPHKKFSGSLRSPNFLLSCLTNEYHAATGLSIDD